MLKRNAKYQRKRVKALTDPKPEFVSLVNAGANKTPFRALRADCIEQDPQHPQDEEARKADSFAVARIEFDGEVFADEDSVVTWLSSGGYADASVTKTETGFLVMGEVPEGTELVEVPGNGFTMYVAETATKTDEDISVLRKKFDEDRAEEGAPLLLNMTMTLYESVSRSLRAGDVCAAQEAIDEYSSLFHEMLEFAPGFTEPTMKAFLDAVAPEVEMTKETEAPANSDVQQDADVVAEKNETVTEEVVAEEDADKVSAEDETTAEKQEDEDKVEAEAETEEKAETEEVVEAAKTEEAPVDPIAALAALVGDLTALVKEQGETIAAKTDALAERVAAVEDVRQTRKGADVDETATTKSSAPTVSDEMSELRRRSMLGMR